MTAIPTPEPRPDLDDRRSREPFYGSCFGVLTLAVLVGGPIWVLMSAVIHAAAVARVFQTLRESGIPVDAFELSVWQVAASLPMLLSSTIQAFILTALLLVLIGAGLVLVRSIALRLDLRLAARATSRYAAESDDAAVLTPESWTRDLPEPDLDAPLPPEPDLAASDPAAPQPPEPIDARTAADLQQGEPGDPPP